MYAALGAVIKEEGPFPPCTEPSQARVELVLAAEVPGVGRRDARFWAIFCVGRCWWRLVAIFLILCGGGKMIGFSISFLHQRIGGEAHHNIFDPARGAKW
jgi:hypothetical protein